ncbi:hypothetical protein BaRGS_00020725 [Batillaria attramentaria]|uniref:NR LBD domain-containing protein n=1 Tax=Batillaria attramentaria TaxID=370345 RepID=A0ABD0KL97_9CAEN
MDVWFLAAHRGFHEQLQIFFAPNKDCQTRAELCRSFGITWGDGSFRLSRRLQKLDLTSHEVMVLSAACLLSSDRCELNAAKQVDDIQWSLINCLLHLLRHSHGACAPLVLARVVACMAE